MTLTNTPLDDEQENENAILRAREVLEQGYYQISARYRLLARLPEGKTGVEALTEASDDPEWAQALGELRAGDQYLRCHSTDRVSLGKLEYMAYRALGGGTYLNRPDPPKTETERLHDAERLVDVLKQRLMACGPLRARVAELEAERDDLITRHGEIVNDAFLGRDTLLSRLAALEALLREAPGWHFLECVSLTGSVTPCDCGADDWNARREKALKGGG